MKPKLYGLIGEARSGKDTVYRMLIMAGLDVHRRAFADQLKLDLEPFIQQCYGFGLFSATPEQKEIVRDLLVAHGRCMRKFQPNYWIQQLALKLPRSGVIVITDCRYLNEANWIEQEGGRLVRIKRVGVGPANEEEKNSLKEIDNLKKNMLYINNDAGLKELQEKIKILAKEIINAGEEKPTGRKDTA